MLQWYSADLHIHTVLSPCAELNMGPWEIVKKALKEKLDIIAITDHNSGDNVQGVMDAAIGTGLSVIPGMEVYVREEAHIICLFPNVTQLSLFQEFIYRYMHEGEYDPSLFGSQIICDKDEQIIGENKRLLSLPLKANLEQIALEVVKDQGLLFPAHINRRANSIIQALGFIPKNLPIHAVEITNNLLDTKTHLKFLDDTRYLIIHSSDAHDIDQIGTARTYFQLAEPTFAEITKALQKKARRLTSLAI